MTLFWIVAAALTAAVAALIVRPLLRRPGPVAGRAGYDLEVYRDQLAEVERDLARGVIEAGQAEAARTEIGRRILTAAPPDSNEAAAPPPARTSRTLALVLLAGIPLGTLAVYLALGRPDLPGQPLAGRMAAAHSEAPPPEVIAAVNHLAERLKAEPGNLEGWVLLAQSLAKMERLPEAVEAWRKAAALAPDDDELRGNLAEALTTANQGTVSDEARALFEALQAKTPAEPRAGHYLALARAQAGDFKGALERWAALVAASPADAPWLPLVRQRVADMAERLKLDVTAVMPKPLPPRGAATGDSGVPADKAAAIRAMVETLAKKLEANPDDVTGWLRLARSYEVLGEPAKQLDALKKALAQAPRNAELLVSYAGALLAQNPPADTDRLPAEAAAALRTALEVAPDSQAALWLLGLDAANAGKADEARALWQKLLAGLDPAGPDAAEIKGRLERLK